MRDWVSRSRRLVRARPWLSAAVAVVLLGGGAAAYLLVGNATSAQAQTGVTTRLTAAAMGTVRQTISTTGTISPADESDVSFAASAEVTSVRVAVGDPVSKGEVLGTIDSLALRAAVAQAQATLAAAQAGLSAAEDTGTATDAQLSADQASVDTAQSSVTAANAALAGATLRSPIAGTVAEVNVAKGDMATGGSGSGGTGGNSGAGGAGNGNAGSNGSSNSAGDNSSSSSSADFVVIGGKQWTVSASVDDTEVGLIKKGNQAQITTDNSTGLIFGTVSSVSVLASTSSGSASYPVTIEVTGSPSGLHDGESATVSIIYRQLVNVLTVPTAAVHTSNGASYVYVSSGGKKVKRTVTVGLTSGGSTQIKTGITAGQQVYVDTFSVGSRAGTTTRTGTNGGFGGNGNLPGGGVFPRGGFGGAGGGFGGAARNAGSNGSGGGG